MAELFILMVNFSVNILFNIINVIPLRMDSRFIHSSQVLNKIRQLKSFNAELQPYTVDTTLNGLMETVQ
jgi:hypothetical protein